MSSRPVRPYREDRDALVAKKNQLERDLAEIAQKRGELGGLDQWERAVAESLAETNRTLHALDGANAKPSILDSVKIAAPCKAEWGDMVGDDRVRFCGQCAKNVYNLSAMPREEAESFVHAHEGGSACVRMYKRADGTMLTSDCPVGVKKRRVRLAIASAVGGGLMAGAAALSLTRMQGAMQPRPEVMGEMTVVTPNVPPPVPQIDNRGGEGWTTGDIAPAQHDPTPPQTSAPPPAPQPHMMGRIAPTKHR